MEESINLGENELFFIADESFYGRQNKAEMAQLKQRQEEEMKLLKEVQSQLLKDRASRKEAKQYQKVLSRSAKQKDSVIYDQEAAHKKATEVKTILSDHLQRVEQLIHHTDEKHKKQMTNLAESQERKISDQKILMDLSVKNLSEDDKVDRLKEFQFKISHQKSVDKKKCDQLREIQVFCTVSLTIQVLELRHLKDRMDLETTTIEDLSAMKANQLVTEQETSRSQRETYLAEKDRIEATKESQKVMQLQSADNAECQKLSATHRAQVPL